MQNDDTLYSLFLSGITSAYDELMIRHGDSLTFYLYGYLRNWQDSEDLMVEAFARIMVKKPHIRNGGFKAYLYKTARNLANRFHSRENRVKNFNLEGMENELPAGLSTEEKLKDKERKRIVHLCLGRLDPELREAIWLVYFEDLSYADAAVVMDVSKKRVDRLLQRGKLMLREELGKEGITNAYE